METTKSVSPLVWADLTTAQHEALSGKLVGMWDHSNDASAFNSLSVAGQQALLLIVARLEAKSLWQAIRQISNVWGEGGVGFDFTAWPILHSLLSRRNDFTQLFANHRDTDGGFVEKDRAMSVMHFLYQNGASRKWSLHFDLHSPLNSPTGAWRHFRYEVLGQAQPDWQMIKKGLGS